MKAYASFISNACMILDVQPWKLIEHFVHENVPRGVRNVEYATYKGLKGMQDETNKGL